MPNDRIGSLDYAACESCKHSHPEDGGCDIDAFDDMSNFEIDGDDLNCLLYVDRSDPDG